MTDTPQTDQFLQTMFRDLGSLGPHNCPEWLVEYARNQELELARMREDRDLEKQMRKDQADRAESWKECAQKLFDCASEDTTVDGFNEAFAMFQTLKARES
jgi:hypothetical protein